MHQDAAPPDSVEVFCYSQHLRGLIRTRVQQMISDVSNCVSSTRRMGGALRSAARLGQTWGLFLLERLNVSGAEAWKTPLSSTALSRTTSCTGCRCRWKPITLSCRRWWMASPAKGLFSSSLKTRITTTAALTSIFLIRRNRAEVHHHCEGSKEELVRDVSRFYSSSHDRFTYGSSFINFNLAAVPIRLSK